MGDFIHHKGMELLLHCLSSDHDKLIIKALFLLTSISAGVSDHVSGELLLLLHKLQSSYWQVISDYNLVIGK